MQQQLSDTANCPVSVVVGNAGPFENLAEQYSLLNRIYRMVDQSAGRLLIVDENTYADLLLGTGSASIQNQFQFSALLQQLDQLMLNVRREIFAEQLGEEPARDTACFDLFNAYLRSGAATQLEMLHRFTDLCAETCRQREENETHSTQAIIKRINRYIEDNVENYDLSLTALARMTGFNPSYLSRFYRINTGKKLSDQIDEAKLQHAKKLIAQGELVKNVAERTGFASPSAFILFFKRNTGVTPRQYFESENKS